MKKACAMILLFFCFFTQSTAQNRGELWDITRYFPLGSYITLTHADYEKARQAEAYPLFKEHFLEKGMINGARGIPLPEALQGKERGYSMAQVFRLGEQAYTINTEKLRQAREAMQEKADIQKDEEDEDQATERHWQRGQRSGRFASRRRGRDSSLMPSPEVERNAETGETTVRFTANEGEQYWVFRYDDIEGFVTGAMESGLFQETGKPLKGRPIYTFQNEGGRRLGSSEYFAYATEMGELLVAESIRGIHMMKAVDGGRLPGMLDDSRYADLFNLYPDLGSVWTFIFADVAIETRIEDLRDSDDPEAEEQITVLEESLEQRPLFTITHFILGDEIRNQTISVYRDGEAAESARSHSGEASAIISGIRNKAVQQHLQKRQNNATTEVDGTWLISTLVYDRELINSQNELRETFRARREEMMQLRK